jgi:hypothetical protein
MNNTQNEVQEQLAKETLCNKKNKITKITVEKNLFNNDSRSIKSLKSLLQKAKTSVKLKRLGQGEYDSDQHNIDRLRKHNYSVQISRQSSIDVRDVAMVDIYLSNGCLDTSQRRTKVCH